MTRVGVRHCERFLRRTNCVRAIFLSVRRSPFTEEDCFAKCTRNDKSRCPSLRAVFASDELRPHSLPCCEKVSIRRGRLLRKSALAMTVNPSLHIDRAIPGSCCLSNQVSSFLVQL